MKKYEGGGILNLLLEAIGLLVIIVVAYIYLRLNPNLLDKVTVIENNITSVVVGTSTDSVKTKSAGTSTVMGNSVINNK